MAKKVINVMDVIDNPRNKQYSLMYNATEDCRIKINRIVKEIYGASSVNYSDDSLKILSKIEEKIIYFPIYITKTPEFFTQDSKKRGIPIAYVATISNIKSAYGAGLIIVL